MIPEEEKKRAEKLRAKIDDLRYRYHVLDDPSASDDVYDSLTRELRVLEEKYPELFTPDSPTQRVGGEPLDKFKKVTHALPMLSLNDAFDEQEVKDWFERITKLDPGAAKSDFYCELKMDGLACSLIYDDGLLVQASTRGDGRVGEDVTQNVKTIEAVPLRLETEVPGRIEVRGEVYMPYKSFEKLNKEREKSNQPKFANPRNAAAGSIRQLDPKLSAARDLSFMAYQLLLPTLLSSHRQEHERLKELGFKANLKLNQMCHGLAEIFKYQKAVAEKRSKLDYQIDGVVIQVDDREIFNRLGSIGKSPRGAIAYKFAPEEVTTRLNDIIVQVGRQGTLTPVAVLEPVEVAGVIVSRATLHNEDEIRRKDVKIGDTVIVRRAGDVIPEIVGPLKELRSGKEKEYHFPKKCPVCGSPIIRASGEVAYRCSNKKCYGSKLLQLRHFTSKAAFDIVGLGPKVIDALYEAGLINEPADFYHLKVGEIEPLERFGELSAKNIVEAINSRRKVSLTRFIIALGIRHVGEETAIALSNHFGDLDKIMDAKREIFAEVKDIGPIVGESIADYFAFPAHCQEIDRLLREVKIEHQAKVAVTGKLAGKSVVVTGTLENMSRSEAQQKARDAGADVNDSVSKNTNYLVVGENPGSKLAKAEQFGVKILYEDDFLKLVE